MGATVLAVTFADPAAATAARPVVAPVLPEAEVQGPVLQGSVADGARSALDVVRLLDRAGLAPVGLTVREPSLDDVFLRLTGHRATSGDELGEVAS